MTKVWPDLTLFRSCSNCLFKYSPCVYVPTERWLGKLPIRLDMMILITSEYNNFDGQYSGALLGWIVTVNLVSTIKCAWRVGRCKHETSCPCSHWWLTWMLWFFCQLLGAEVEVTRIMLRWPCDDVSARHTLAWRLTWRLLSRARTERCLV